MVRAYETVGLPEAALVLKKADAEFPNAMRSRNPDRLRDFREEHEEGFESLSRQFFRAEKNERSRPSQPSGPQYEGEPEEVVTKRAHVHLFAAGQINSERLEIRLNGKNPHTQLVF